MRQLTMLEGDRFEVLDITVREDSELVGIPFRELPLTGSLIGAIVRDGNAIFPHGNDDAAGGRPGDPLHRVVPRRVGGCSRRRCGRRGPGGRSPALAARRRRRRGTFNLVGALLRYLGLTFLVPGGCSRSGYDEPVWPFAVSGVDHRGGRPRARGG